eukprot:436177_1
MTTQLSAFTMLLFCLFNAVIYATTWSPAPPLPFPMYGSVVSTNRDHTLMYLIGGMSNTTYQFDGNSFKSIGTVPLGMRYDNVQGFSATVNDITYFFNTEEIIGFNTTSTKVEWYNISLPKASGGIRNAMCLVANDTHLFYLENPSNGSLVDIIFAYDIENQQWLDQNSFAAGQWWGPDLGACVYYNHAIYIFGGLFSFKPHDDYVNPNHEILMYNFIQNEWSIVGNLTYSPIYFAAIMPNKNGIIYIISGGNDSAVGAYKTVDVWNANTKQIVETSSLNIARGMYMVGFLNKRIYVMGGFTSDVSLTKTTEMSNIIPTLPPTRSPTRSPTKNPTHSPTIPTKNPTHSPTIPTKNPTHSPTIPTKNPTHSPTKNPTHSPTHSPTIPTISPSRLPTGPPTDIVNISLSSQQLIYCVSAAIVL